MNQSKILDIPIVLNSSNAMPGFLDFNFREYYGKNFMFHF